MPIFIAITSLYDKTVANCITYTPMIADYLRLNILIKDEEFDIIYPIRIREMSKRHFTQVEMAIKASQFLATNAKQRVLDIGSGVGKFCFIAGASTEAIYTGVEYRKHLVDLCKKLTLKHRFKNVNFIHDDIKNIDFTQFDSFYFFNSFQEQIDSTALLDHTIDTNYENYLKYSLFLKSQFAKMPEGTRIVTLHVNQDQIPESYRLLNTCFDGKLKCWEQTTEAESKLL